MVSEPDFPIIISEWDRNSRERVRVVLDRYNGHNIVSLKNLYRAADGNGASPRWAPA
jgi:hypothetical protein